MVKSLFFMVKIGSSWYNPFKKKKHLPICLGNSARWRIRPPSKMPRMRRRPLPRRDDGVASGYLT